MERKDLTVGVSGAKELTICMEVCQHFSVGFIFLYFIITKLL